MTTQQLTKQQKNILTLIYKHRFLNRPQIQTLLNHKTHNRINGWLKDLYENKFIERIYSHQFGENTKPAIYSIGPAGIRFLKSQNEIPPEALRRLYREPDRSAGFRDRCQYLADICITLHKANTAADQTEPLYEYATEIELLSPDSQFHFLADTKPELVVAKHELGSEPAYSLVNSIELTTPPYAAQKHLRDYFALYASNGWEENMDVPFPNVVIVCPNVDGLIRFKRYARKLLEDNQQPDLNIWFTTADKLKAGGITGNIWEEA
jgi:hypothetical protein